MKLDEIKLMIKELEKSSLKKVQIKDGNFELLLEKETVMPAKISYEAPRLAMPEVVAPPQLAQKNLNTKEIKSPIVGTFYASPAPDQPAFVRLGDMVDEDTVVCVVEAMKVMNEVKASQKGKIIEILVEDSNPVEFGTILFRVE